MIKYKHAVSFPMDFDDFWPKDEMSPHPGFTLMTAEEYDDGAQGDEEGYDEVDHWWNIVVNHPEITRDIARREIAAKLGTDFEEVYFA